MELIITLGAYTVLSIFCWRFISNAIILSNAGEPAMLGKRSTFHAIVISIINIVFLRRLFLINKGLWLGEWLFHTSFILVVMRHLRFFYNPVPEFIVLIQPIGVYAGYVLPCALLYIFAYRFFVGKGAYISTSNITTTILIFITSLTGVALHYVYKTDIAQVKEFVLSGLTFSIGTLPSSTPLVVHLILVLAAFVALPSHILVAPLVTLDVGRRNEGVMELMHEK